MLEGLRRVLGEEHPDTLTSMNNLASTLRAQGDAAGARALEEGVLEVRRRVQGEEHPDTLSSMHHLCCIQDESPGEEVDRFLLEELLAGVSGLGEGTPIRVAAEARWLKK